MNKAIKNRHFSHLPVRMDILVLSTPRVRNPTCRERLVARRRVEDRFLFYTKERDPLSHVPLSVDSAEATATVDFTLRSVGTLVAKISPLPRLHSLLLGLYHLVRLRLCLRLPVVYL